MAERAACKAMVALLSLAQDRSCEAQLASVLADDLDHRRLPDLNALLARFAPDPACFAGGVGATGTAELLRHPGGLGPEHGHGVAA